MSSNNFTVKIDGESVSGVVDFENISRYNDLEYAPSMVVPRPEFRLTFADGREIDFLSGRVEITIYQ